MTGKDTLNLNSDTLQAIVDLLIPLVQDENNRRPLIVQAFGTGSPLLRQITWGGNANAFANNLVLLLVEHGEVKPGKQALWELMRTVRGMVGVDKQRRIDDLQSLLTTTQIKSLERKSMSSKFTHGYALLIGAGESSYPKWSLPVTVKDIQAIHKILVDPDLCAYSDNDQHIRLLHDAGATNQAILNGLGWLKTQAANDAKATIIVYYSGHGWFDQSTSRYYLIPHDVEPFDIPRSSLAAETFTQALRDIPAKRLLVFIDSCHAEGMATAKDAPMLKTPSNFEQLAPPKSIVEKLRQGEGRAVFTSSRGEQKSWIRPDGTMSIYTYHLIEALQGAGNRPGDTLVNVSNLMNHLAKTVPTSAQQLCEAEQVPFFDTATEDFPIAMLRGGKGLPDGGWDEIQAEAAETMRQIINIFGDGNIVGIDGANVVSAGKEGTIGDVIQVSGHNVHIGDKTRSDKE